MAFKVYKDILKLGDRTCEYVKKILYTLSSKLYEVCKLYPNKCIEKTVEQDGDVEII